MNYNIAKNCMMTVANCASNIESFGVSDADFALTTQQNPWLATDRNRVKKVLDSLIYGTMDAIGVPRFDAPAEYVAAVLAVFVSDDNLQNACRWHENLSSTDDYVQADVPQTELITAQQLFSLVLSFNHSDKADQARSQFEKRCQKAIEFAQKNEPANTDPARAQAAATKRTKKKAKVSRKIGF